MSNVRTRFAPSPTGRLHLGHAFSAKTAHDFALENGGVFLLRHEDIDATRVRPEYYAEIESDLQWLGFEWTGEPLRQSTRLPLYESALASLRGLGVCYPCFCTRREIEAGASRILSAPHGPEGPVYPGTCRNLSPTERQAKLDAGFAVSWRLHAAATAKITGPLTFDDLRFGQIAVLPQLLGDVVLARKDIGTSYHLAVVVDDAFQEITHVTRGEDLLDSTHVHRLLQTLLKLPQPVYFHHSLVVDESGKRLAKRNDALAISTMRQNGLTPREVFTKFRF